MELRHSLQLNDYYCGPAVMQMILAAHDVNITQDEAAKIGGTTEQNGTSPEGMVTGLTHFGMSVDAGNNKTLKDIQNALDEGKIIIVCYVEQQWKWDHYAIVLGMENGQIQLLDPAEDASVDAAIGLELFNKEWRGPLFTHTDHWAAFVSGPTSTKK